MNSYFGGAGKTFKKTRQMKKVFLMAVALMSMVTLQAQANKEEIAKSQERAAKLQKLCDGYNQKGCGNDKIDGYGKSMYDAAILAIANSTQLENLYTRQIGETKDGVTDVTVSKPSLDEWLTLAATITAEGVSVNEAVSKVNDASKEVKEMTESAGKEKNPMKAAKAAKSAKTATAVLEFGNAATPILVEESAAQAKAVQQIISTIKSGGNL